MRTSSAFSAAQAFIESIMTTSISNHDDRIDSRDVIARIEELRGSLVPRYVAGTNMPGYMPDSDPAEFDDEAEARDHISEEMEMDADRAEENGDTELAEELREVAKKLRDSDESEVSIIIGGRCYWVTRDGDTGLDDDEREELAALEALAAECEGCGDWRHGEVLIRASDFENYARELADDCGHITGHEKWPLNCIDWEQAARELAYDYTTVDFGGVDYMIRA